MRKANKSALISKTESICGIYNLVFSVQLAQDKRYLQSLQIFLQLLYLMSNTIHTVYQNMKKSILIHPFLKVLQLVGKRVHMCLLKERTHTF